MPRSDAMKNGAATDPLADVVGLLCDEVLVQGHPVAIDDQSALMSRVREAAPLLSTRQVTQAARRITRRLFGLGPLDELFEDDTITEVMVNGPGPVWVERNGSVESAALHLDAAMIDLIIERIVGPLGLRVDRTSPFVDARLGDGSRVHIAIPPLALDGPYITVRRFSPQPFELDDFGSASVVAVLEAALERRSSVLVSGGTGAGKTSLLNSLGRHLPAGERVLTIEDAAELQIPGPHVVRLEARPPNAEGVGGVSIRTLVRNALRMRPDRLVVGEVRGAEALDLLQAMNTGHEGTLATCHANSPTEAMQRLESMVLMSDVALPLDVVRHHLHTALDLVVQVRRDLDGRRAVTDIAQIAPGEVIWLVRDHEPTTAGTAYIEAAA